MDDDANPPSTALVISDEAASLMAVINRAAADPNTDVDKLERLLGMYERITAQAAETAFNAAMTAAQSEIAPVAKDAANKQTSSRYASFAALDRAVRDAYVRHGFSLSYDTAEGAPADHVRVVCRVGHAAGHARSYHVDMPADGKGAKGGDVMTRTHATGSAMSYGQRYLLKLIFNIAVSDDDGNRAALVPVTAHQAAELARLTDEAGADRLKFLNFPAGERLHRASGQPLRRSRGGAAEAQSQTASRSHGGRRMTVQSGYQAAITLVCQGTLIANALGHLEEMPERRKDVWRNQIRRAADEVRYEALADLDECLAASDALAAGE